MALMTTLAVAVKYLRGRAVASALTALSIALEVSLLIASVILTGGSGTGSSRARLTKAS